MPTQLRVYEKSLELIVEVYQLSRALPRHELYCLASQIRRAAVSIAANISEGNGRFHAREFLHSLSHARGSLREVETFLRVVVLLDYMGAGQTEPAARQCDEISRMLTMLRRRLLKDLQSPVPSR